MTTKDNPTNTPRMEVRRQGEVTCDWCSVDGSRFVRIVPTSWGTSEDYIDLCDPCAIRLRDAITRKLTASRKFKDKK